MAATKAVLFDVDGTLMRAGGAGREALARAAADIYGLSVEHARLRASEIDFRGATDSLIFAELCERLERPWSGWSDPLVSQYVATLDHCLDEAQIETMPGIAALLRALTTRGIILGLLTGNIKSGAERKLRRIQLHPLVGGPGAFGEDGHHRNELATAAHLRLEQMGILASQTVVIGDTPHDVAAARHIGAQAVAVGTGWTPWADLEASKADLLLRDLGDATPIIDLIEGL